MPRVIDLSALWAGPLCSNLWQAAGAEVIKVESSQRADGARSGSRAFFEQLNRGKESVVLDLHRPSGQQALRDLLSQADIVLEASRPRALRQMGIIAEELVGETPNLSWVSITGYGRREPQANWIAYGDDRANLFFWRTKSGNEVDFVVYGPDVFCAIEVKNTAKLRPQALSGLISFKED